MPLEQVQFQVAVLRAEREYKVTLTAQRIQPPATAAFQLDPRSPEWDQCRQRILSQQTSEQFFRAIGAKLFEALFPQQHRTSYEINYQHVKERFEQGALQVQLRLLEDELGDLPWECLYNPTAKLWLAANPQTPLSRYVDVPAPPPLELDPPLRLLIVTAEPRSLPAINAEREVEAVKSAIAPLLKQNLIEAKLMKGATPRALQGAIEKFRPHLFHFVGHGRRTGSVSHLVLEKPDGALDLLSADLLCELLQLSGHVRGAVLNACETSGTALTLAKAGIAAIGMWDIIRSEAAVSFCRSFYEAVANSVPLDIATNRARFTMRLECGGERRDWCLPALFLPGGRANLFEVRVEEKARAYPGKTAVVEPVRPKAPVETTPGFLVVSADRSGARISAIRHLDGQVTEMGVIGDLKRAGPVRLQPGRYRITASWPGRVGSSEQEVEVRAGETAHAHVAPSSRPILRPESYGRPSWALPALLAIGMVAVLLLLIGLICLYPPRKPRATTTAQAPPVQPQQPSPPPTPETTPKPPIETPAAPRAEAKPAETPQPPAAPPPPTTPLEMQMVSIPAGEAHLGYRDSTVTMKLIEKYKLTANPIFVDILKSSPRKVTLASYFIDKTEVTNAQYRKFLAAVKARGDAACRHPSQPAEKKDHTPDSETWKDPTFNQDTQPVVAIDWYDAYAYAEWANKRLPTEDEWQLAARGKEAFAYPWGNSYEPGRANIDQDQARAPAPVGRFAGDRSPFGLLDMAGNVSEWTATEGEEKNSRVTCGGAWNCRDGDVLGLLFLRRFADPDVRRAYRGLRCAADARPGASAPGDMIRIPGGEVTLGGETGPLLEFLRSLPVKADLIQKELLSEKPRNVKLPAFRICRYEVTNAQYRRFLDYVRANGDAPYRHSDQPPGKDHTPQFWNDPDLNGDDKPVVGVDWYDAYAFAKWVGMRLPTADEWEYAARGNTDNLYPWGDTFSAGKCNGAEAGAKGTASVGSFSTDCSPFGAMDMGGNVWEWTADDCPGTEGKAKRLKGGAWTADCKLFAVIYLRLRGAVLSYRDNSIGFRYAQDVSTP